MRNRFNWTFEGSQPLPVANDFAGDDTIKITFVTPEKREPIDLTPPAPPPSPYEGQAPDLSKPAIEPPRERTETRYGTYEYPRAEQPPSVFDRSNSKDWMR
jgi:hypothetical protein